MHPRCVGCGRTPRFCTFCGAAFGNEPHKHVGRPPHVPDWAKELPRRPLSALEVFAHTMGVQLISDDSADVDEDVMEEHVRRRKHVATQWLLADAATRELCSERAALWSARCANTTSTAAPTDTRKSVKNSTDVVAPLDAATPNNNNNKRDAASPRARGSSLDAHHRTSYNLFRTAMKGRAHTMSEVGEMWRNMTAEEKAPYDEKAARLRTASILAATQEQQHCNNTQRTYTTR